MKKLIQAALLSTIGCSVSYTASAINTAQYYNCVATAGCEKVYDIWSLTSYNKTEHPVVLAHGALGWTKLFKLIDYFNGVPETLTLNGATVFSTKTSSINSSEVRGEQLYRQIQTITAITGDTKVNIIGHSQGGTDARYVATIAPEVVASVTSVATPHKGTEFVDWLQSQLQEADDTGAPIVGELNSTGVVISDILGAVGNLFDLSAGINPDDFQEQEAINVLDSLSVENANIFNDKYPAPLPATDCGMPDETEVNGIGYYSFSGVGQITNPLDVTDYVLALTALPFGDVPNDGLVGQCSSRMGYVIRDDYRMNHLDTVNHLLGLTPIDQPNPLALYRNQVNRLKNEGY